MLRNVQQQNCLTCHSGCFNCLLYHGFYKSEDEEPSDLGRFSGRFVDGRDACISMRTHAAGSFPEPVYAVLVQDRALLLAIAQQLLDDHFSGSLHERLLEAVGLDMHAENEKECATSRLPVIMVSLP
jgi:hypothetical protein